MKNALLAGLAGLLLLSTAAAQDEPTLKVGDPAPALRIAEWVKGKPVERFEAGKVYLVEFWATWCGPCIVSMPHLSALQGEYAGRGVTVIGVTTEDSRNPLEKVKEMVQAKKDGMAYTIAWDEGRETRTAYMTAARQRGIPCSFLVDKAGKVAWIGHPNKVDVPLAYVVAGKWDYVEGPAMMRKIDEAMRALVEAAADNPIMAVVLYDDFVKTYPLAAKGLEELHFSILVQLPDQREAAEKLGAELVEKESLASNSTGLNAFAWGLVDPEVELEYRFLDLALEAAEKANELTEGEDGAILDTLARVHFWRGDLAKALAIQRKAVELADERMKEQLEEALKEYEKALAEKGR